MTPKTPARQTGAASRPNSLGLGPREVADLLSRLDTEQQGKANPRRQFVRANLRLPGVVVRLAQPGGTDAELNLVCRNISREGMSLLHGAFVHQGSPITALLPTTTGETRSIAGKVVRCIHRSGRVHELGIKFNAPVDLRDFIASPDGDDPLSFESVDPEKLVGVLALVCAGPLDRQIIQGLLRGTQLRLRDAKTVADASAMLKEHVDIVFFNATVPLDASVAAVAEIRTFAPRTPIVVIAPDPSALMQLRSKRTAANLLISKPLSQKKIQRTLAEFLLIERKEATKPEEQESPLPMLEMSSEVAAEITGWIESLQQDLQSKDAKALSARCQHVRSAAPIVGLPRVAGLAQTISESLGAVPDVDAIASKVKELITLCEQATKAA